MHCLFIVTGIIVRLDYILILNIGTHNAICSKEMDAVLSYCCSIETFTFYCFEEYENDVLKYY